MNSLFMLDTDIARHAMKGSVTALNAYLRNLDMRQLCISAVTRAELRFGVRRLRTARKLETEVEKFLSGIRTLPWDEEAADRFADVRASLETVGMAIGIMDTMIAAHALAIKATLVTNNVKPFRHVKGLRVENWAR